MDAESPQTAELSLPQAFLLLATSDKDGKPEVPVFALRSAVAGAVLAELDLLGAIELQGKHVKATGSTPATDYQRELELIRGKSRPHTPKQWVSILEGRAEVQRIYEGMVSLGIVEHVGEKHLGLFRSTRYPEKNHGPEAALLQKIEAALNGSTSAAATPGPTEPKVETPESATGVDAAPETAATDATASDAPTPDTDKPGDAAPGPKAPDAKAASNAPDARTTALIALLQAAGRLGRLFPGADPGRVMALSTGHWPSRAVDDELRLTRIAEEEEATL
ncbi:GOLPH3/VPS74 family protein [Pseudarthrobacter sp. 1C304]|uniref:GOLPH3/VPS74 family protein n=1 Tax=Pseudarthrobacter sp. 1C304 TaxID=3457438 RepID=UPI003FD33A23